MAIIYVRGKSMSRAELQCYMKKVFLETKAEVLRYITIKCDSAEDIQDIFQSTYLKFWQRINKFGTTFILNPKQYLLRIAQGETIGFYKEKGLKKAILSIDNEEFGEIPDSSFLCEQVAENKILSDQIWSEIKQFDDLSVRIFTLRFVYDEKLEDIAEAIGIPVSTVKNRLYRGLEKLKNVFGVIE
jgi:RNA polymerase sigma-70 factor, ECF subfamily